MSRGVLLFFVLSSLLLEHEAFAENGMLAARTKRQEDEDRLFNCFKTDFNKEVSKCCKRLPGDYFSRAQLIACNKNKRANDKLFAFATSFAFNQLMNIHNENTIDLNINSTYNQLAEAACFVDCLLKNMKIATVDEGAGVVRVDAELFGTGFLKTLPTTWQEQDTGFWSVVINCGYSVENMDVNKLNISLEKSDRECPLEPIFFLQCVHRGLLQSCPEDLFKKSETCENSITTIEECPLKMTAREPTLEPEVNQEEISK